MLFINDLYQYFENINLNYKIINNYKSVNSSIQFDKNKFLSNNLKDSIELLKYSTNFSFLSNDIYYKITIYHKKTTKIISLIKYIIIYISFISSFSTQKKTVTINYFLTNRKKTMNNKKIFSSNEVNSGSANMYNEINIWRKEELLKLTIHELLHILNVDIPNKFNLELLEYYNTKYNLEMNSINLTEAYVEFWAVIMNVYLYTKIINNSIHNFIKNIKKEQKFNYIQYSKILKISSKNMNQYTHVFSYYILKYELFHNLSKILQFSFFENDKLIYLKKNKLTKFITLLKNLEFIPVKKVMKNNKYYTTMRMTLLEVK